MITIFTSDITDIIYDTLMENRQHAQFDVNNVEDCEVDNTNGTINFDYHGRKFKLTVTEI